MSDNPGDVPRLRGDHPRVHWLDNVDALSIALQACFYAIFLGALWRSLRRPGPLEIAVVAIFGSTAVFFASTLLNQLLPGGVGFLQPLALTALLAQPLLVFWLVHQIRPLRRWVLPLTFAAFVVATLGIVLPATRQPLAALFVGLYFIVGEGGAALLLVRDSQRRYGLARLRLALAGLGTLLFAAAIFIASLAVAAAPLGAQGDPTALFVSRLSALLAAVSYLAAFVPPRWLRHLGQRAIAFDLARAVVTTSGDPGLLWRRLALAARDILGARIATVSDVGGSVVASTDGDSAAHVASDGRPTTRVEVALPSGGRQTHRLEATVDGRPLFVEDDVTVIALLGSMTLRAVEREEAVLRLAEATHQLEAAQAIKASEARFRALLAADPNAIFAVDDAGLVTWATGTTGDLFGRPADQLVGTPLADLIRVDATNLGDLGGDGQVRHGHATGQRADGSQFPADVAWTRFELDGQTYRLAVVSDASWRQEANLMRDRFLGVLSHELRTPTTSIYGGTQLLLRRGDRLDGAERTELLASVAAESERLQRIIENLLVLARVERGADFFEPRPVALKPVLTDLLARERSLLADMALELHIPHRLPLVASDEEYLTLVMRNLLSNAAKYAGPRPRVDVVVERAGEEVNVLVGDDGPGPQAEDAEKLFSLYYRAPGSAAAPGAGIGLFVCRGLVTAMGGRIWARRRPEGGAEFGFSLPVYEDAEPPSGGGEPSAAERQAPAPAVRG
ncbi:MAG: ATP-binding protein [Chloroflexota bacterium]|nr:ATP-binding protein [Chloroflexota bacterium]